MFSCRIILCVMYEEYANNWHHIKWIFKFSCLVSGVFGISVFLLFPTHSQTYGNDRDVRLLFIEDESVCILARIPQEVSRKSCMEHLESFLQKVIMKYIIGYNWTVQSLIKEKFRKKDSSLENVCVMWLKGNKMKCCFIQLVSNPLLNQSTVLTF